LVLVLSSSLSPSLVSVFGVVSVSFSSSFGSLLSGVVFEAQIAFCLLIAAFIFLCSSVAKFTVTKSLIQPSTSSTFLT